MDLISQIVATKDNVEITEIKRDLENLTAANLILKGRMENELNDSNKNLIRSIKFDRSTSLFQDDLDNLTSSLIELEKRVKNLNEIVSDSEKITMFSRIKETFDKVNILQSVQKVQSIMFSIDKVCQANPLVAAENLMQSKLMIDQGFNKKEFLNFYKGVLKRHSFFLSSFKYELNNKWDKAVSFVINNQGLRGLKTVKLNVALNTQPSLEKLYQSLTTLKSHIAESFAESLFENILKPLLFHPCELNVKKTQELVSITLSYQDKLAKMPLVKVFNNLFQIFEVINNCLNLKRENVSDFIPCVGYHCEAEFTSLFIQHHLSNLDVDNTHEVTNCQGLVYAMLLNHFILKSNKLVKYLDDILTAQNKNILTHYINNALVLLKNDLLNSVPTESIDVTLSSSEYNMYAPDRTVMTQCFKSDYTINIDSLNHYYKKCLFPECHVSKSIGELVQFIQGIFEQSDVNQVVLWAAVHEIINIYLTSPRLHVSSPRHSALIFNNSMYFALHLVIFGRDCQTRFPFCGAVSKLQNLALSELDRVVTAEQTNLIDSMNKSGLSNTFNLEKFPDSCEKAIKCCIQQLNLLRSSWFEVLPTEVYRMAMGHLCSSFLEEIISSVMLAKNLNSNVKNSLYILFNSISKSIELIMMCEDTIEKFVKNWAKWKELSMLFNANLSTILTRWDSKMGPLSQHFSSMQIRDFVTALFPQSEFRERTLNTIF